MGALRDRLRFDEATGTVWDADRRYLLMRADVLMGALRELDPDARGKVLAALESAAARFGGKSLQAYAAAGGDVAALVESTVKAAADLGWGRWALALRDAGERPTLELEVHGSPFAAGWAAAGDGGSNASTTPTCGPVAGILRALAAQVLPGEPGPIDAQEIACAAQGAPCCRFCARRIHSTARP